MKNNNERVILEKGFYNHPQRSGRMQLKQYIIVRENGKKCLLLRFFNESELVVNGMEIVLTKKASGGKLIDDVTVRLNGLSVRPGDTYTTTNGIVIDEECVDFTVELKSITSADYEYQDIKGRLVPRYDPRAKGVVRTNKYGNVSVKRIEVSRSRLSALIAVILVAGFSALAVYVSLRTFGNFKM